MNHGSALFLESWSIVRACMLRLLGTSSQQANLKLIIICRTTGQQPAPLIKITHHLPLLVIQLSTLLLFCYIFCLINYYKGTDIQSGQYLMAHFIHLVIIRVHIRLFHPIIASSPPTSPSTQSKCVHHEPVHHP